MSREFGTAVNLGHGSGGLLPIMATTCPQIQDDEARNHYTSKFSLSMVDDWKTTTKKEDDDE